MGYGTGGLSRSGAIENKAERRASLAEQIQPGSALRTVQKGRAMFFLNARLSDDLEVETFGNISGFCSAHYEFFRCFGFSMILYNVLGDD